MFFELKSGRLWLFVCSMVFNATFNNISVILWWSALLVEETRGVPGLGENHWPVTSHWQTFSHNVVHLALIMIRTHNIRQIWQSGHGFDTCHWIFSSCFSFLFLKISIFSIIEKILPHKKTLKVKWNSNTIMYIL